MQDRLLDLPPASVEAAADEPGRARHLTPPALVSVALLAVLAAVLVLLNLSAARGISPYDEATHADYVQRITDGSLPAAGDTLAQEVLAEWACRGPSRGSTLQLPPCGAVPYDPAAFPAGGSQYNSSHPPLYYAVTAAVAGAVGTVTGAELLQASRVAGIAWLTAGLWLLLAATRRLGASWTQGTAVAALVALAPGVMHPSSTVNNDAAAVLSGSLVLLVTLRVLQNASSWPAFAAVAAVVVAMKTIFVVALVPAGVVLLLHLRRNPADRARVLQVLAAGAVASIAVTVLWTVFQSGRGDHSVPNPVLGINTRDAESPPVAVTLRNLLAAWPPLARAFVPVGLDEPQLYLWTALVPLLFAGAPLLGMLAGRSVTVRDLGLGTALGLLAVPVAVQRHTYVTHGHYFPDVAPRYGLSLVPALALALAGALRGRRDDVAVAVLAVLGAVAVVSALLVSL